MEKSNKELLEEIKGLQKCIISLEMQIKNGKDFEEVLRMERLILKYALELEKARAGQNEAVAYLRMLMAKQFED